MAPSESRGRTLGKNSDPRRRAGLCMADRERTVLVVDDEPRVREMLSEYLTERSFEVIEAGNGLEALAALKNHRPSAIVLDLRMPRLGASRP
jgi:CheY-like chemotaxis protein